MTSGAILSLCICIAIVIVAVIVVLAIIIYHQMLLYNQVNKRLLLMTKESIEKTQITMDELQERLDNFESEFQNTRANTQIDIPSENEEAFDPHTFNTDDLT